MRAVNAAGEIDWNNDGKRYDVDWIINWQGYQIVPTARSRSKDAAEQNRYGAD
ncbi:hypothetical protein M8494_22585 [Serratia ureilytica]